MMIYTELDIYRISNWSKLCASLETKNDSEL